MRKLGRFMNCLRLFICHLAVYVCARDRGIFHLGMYYISLPPPPPLMLPSREFQLHFSPDLQEKLLYDPPTSTPCGASRAEKMEIEVLQILGWGGGGGMASAGKKEIKPKTNQITLTH